MELRNLMTFKTILEEGSFQNAAQKLGYTQSTITFQMQQLEQELSIKLFEKIGRKMMLTLAGKDILPYIDSILQSMEQINNYGKSNVELTGELKIAIPESLLTYKMQPVIKAFRNQAPNIKLALRSLNCYMIRDQILNGEADVGIHYDVGGYNPTITTVPLGTFSVSLLASPMLDKEFHDFISPNQKKELAYVMDDRHSIYKEIFEEYLKSKNILLGNTLELWSIETIKRSTASNLGVAFLPTFTAENELANGTLIELDTEMSSRKITALCAYHKNKWISPGMELFMRLAKDFI